MLKRICVYCGSSSGGSAVYGQAAEALAEALVDNNIELVYGGAHKGIMGVLADAVLARGGRVQGVIPRMLEEKEIAHTGLSELHVVNSMHERKSMMAALSDAFVALPGGFGTLEELIEILTWGQLRFHEKPCGVLNVGGYFDKLIEFLDHMQDQQFLKPRNRAMLLVDTTASGLLAQFDSYAPPATDKWL